MIVPKTFNECCYILTNFSNSNNPIFSCQEEIENFKRRLEEKLKGIAEILAWNFQTDHYQILIALKSRSCFEEFYRIKHEMPDLEGEQIPESYLILSQEMANVQSGYAKWFNFRHKRFGSLFGRRYTKVLLETKNEVETAVQNMNEGKRLWDFEKLWSYIWNFLEGRMKELGLIDTSSKMYVEGDVQLKCWFSGFLKYSDWDLRGNYIPVPALSHFH